MPLFEYKKLHNFSLITEPLLKYLSQSKVIRILFSWYSKFMVLKK